MRPNKLGASVFQELPPVLAHYVETERHQWVEGNPRRGRISVMNRPGVFCEIESMAVERRHLLEILGKDRTRAFQYRLGFEQGRRDAVRHYQQYGENVRLALQAGLVYAQLQGRFVTETIRFEFDLEARTLFRDLHVTSCAEALVHRMALEDGDPCVCWNTAGYLSGHVSELVGRKVLTLEKPEADGESEQSFRFISRMDGEFGEEANWAREALKLKSLDSELQHRDQLIENAQRAARRAQATLGGMSRRLRPEMGGEEMDAASSAMQSVLSRARQLMQSDAPVIISGETGTGKATLSRMIHSGGARKKKPFIEVDCVGLSDALLRQELFGYEKDAFAGATLKHTGSLVRARGGMVYLNEVTDIPLELQGQLLRVMETGEVLPRGSDKPVKADVRIIFGSRFDPAAARSNGRLRDDLYYAMAVGRISLPPLRERAEDVLRLADRFLREFQEKHRRPKLIMDAGFRQALQDCSWPGNIRQLKHVVEHAVIMSMEDELTARDLPDEILASRWKQEPRTLSPEVIKATLNRTHNNRSKAAELLGVGRTTLWRSMKRYGIE